MMQAKQFLRLIVIFKHVITAYGNWYARYEGIHMINPCLPLVEDVKSPLSCVILCAHHHSGTCKAGSYHRVHKTCCIGAEAFDGNAQYVEDEDSCFFTERPDHIWYDDWALVFRAVSGNGLSLYDAWTNSGHQDDGPVATSTDRLQWGCLTMNGSLPCHSHFRSQYLDNWPSTISKVSLRMYKNGENVADVVFDGTGSDVTSWMQPSRIFQTPWTDMTQSASDYNRFAIATDWGRRFFINRNYGGCPNDWGWMCATDVASATMPCSWEGDTFPAFFYSTLSTGINWNTADKGVADVLAVFIQF